MVKDVLKEYVKEQDKVILEFEEVFIKMLGWL